jgi:hypothetical protein
MRLEHIGDSVKMGGYYEEDEDLIYLAAGLGKLKSECVYFHERQHRNCCKNKCQCWREKNDYLSEFHAYLGELEDVVARGSRRLAKVYLRLVRRMLVSHSEHPEWKDHKRAMNRVMRRRKFREVQELAGETL